MTKAAEFSLSDQQRQRIGGDLPAEIMRRLLGGEAPVMVQENLGIEPNDWKHFTTNATFKHILELKRSRLASNRITAKRPVSVSRVFAIPRLQPGKSPAEWAMRRISELTPQAVERLAWLMNNAHNESIMYNAATKLLALNGIVEVEKSITVIADAEAVIRELNRRPQKVEKIEPAISGDSEIVIIEAEEVTSIEEPLPSVPPQEPVPFPSNLELAVTGIIESVFAPLVPLEEETLVND